MKKRLLYVWTLAVMITSCNKNLEVTITPVNLPPPPIEPITYYTAEGVYFGDMLGNGAACYILKLYNSSNPNIGIYMKGYCSLPSSFTDFKLDIGTYNYATNGAIRTFSPGMISAEGTDGTFLYNNTTSQVTYITGGSFSVELSDNIYSITTNFTGKEAGSGDVVRDICINYTGAINFVDDTKISVSSYLATGTPKWKNPPGDSSWSGTATPVSGSTTSWYEITNWANQNIRIYLDDEEGTIMIDDYSRVYHTSTHDYYFRVGFIEEGGTIMHVFEGYDYIVNYNPYTKILDFTGTITYEGKSYDAVVGIAGYDKTTSTLEIIHTDFYTGVKLQLTPVQPSFRRAIMPQSQNLTDVPAKTNRMRSSSRTDSVGSPIIIAPNKSGNAKIQTITIN